MAHYPYHLINAIEFLEEEGGMAINIYNRKRVYIIPGSRILPEGRDEQGEAVRGDAGEEEEGREPGERSGGGTGER